MGVAGWEVFSLTHLRAEELGVVWFGEGEEQVSVVYSRKAVILLMGEAVREWVSGG